MQTQSRGGNAAAVFYSSSSRSNLLMARRKTSTNTESETRLAPSGLSEIARQAGKYAFSPTGSYVTSSAGATAGRAGALSE